MVIPDPEERQPSEPGRVPGDLTSASKPQDPPEAQGDVANGAVNYSVGTVDNSGVESGPAEPLKAKDESSSNDETEVASAPVPEENGEQPSLTEEPPPEPSPVKRGRRKCECTIRFGETHPTVFCRRGSCCGCRIRSVRLARSPSKQGNAACWVQEGFRY